MLLSGAGRLIHRTDYVSAASSAEGLPDRELNGVGNKPDGTVHQGDVHPTGVKASGREVKFEQSGNSNTIPAGIVRRDRVGVERRVRITEIVPKPCDTKAVPCAGAACRR